MILIKIIALVVCHCYDKIFEQVNLRRVEISLDSRFRGVRLWPDGSVAFLPVVAP